MIIRQLPSLRIVRWLKRIVIGLLVVVLGATAYGVFVVRNSFPQVSGELEVAGLDSNVEVLRDELGVPHIYASSQHDLFFAQGYTHAQDRFWQMDVWRHIGAGRLSEMFGASQIDTDVFLRSLGWESIAGEEWEAMGSPAREILQAYADGVNAYLDTHSGSEISLEYAILPLQNSSYRIEPWTPLNTLTWVKVMAWDLRNNLDDEIARAVLGRDLSAAQVADLYPPFPADKPVIVESPTTRSAGALTASLPDGAMSALGSLRNTIHALDPIGGARSEGIGSNNWVVSGALTASGSPLLANDTHLAVQMPSIWYENGLHCTGEEAGCVYDLVGYSFAGSPGVVIGHNAHHAWGVTNQAADTADLFIERVNPEDPLQYDIDGEWVPFEVRAETIGVGGGEDATYDILTSRHGPVISGSYLDEDVFDDSSMTETPGEYVVSLSWRALQPSTTVEAILGINRASSYEEFQDAVNLWDTVPQNVVYADVEGNIAYHATGEIPIRADGDGTVPVPGWTSQYEWTGFLGTADKPSLLNPAEGYIESANQPVVRGGGDPLIGLDASYGYRSGRIVELLAGTEPHTVATMQEMQLDQKELGAVYLVPHLLALDPGGDEQISQMQTFLEGWSTGNSSYQAQARSSGAAAYMGVWRQVLALTFHDQLPEDYWPTGGSRWFEIVRNLLDEPENPWWDITSTPQIETRDDILLQSMAMANDELSELLGDDPASWTWGELHIAHFENQTLGQSGIAPVEWLFNRSAPPRVGGSASVVDAVGWNPAVSYEVDWSPSQRMVVDLGDLDSSRFIHTTGQSGHAFAADYGSMIEMWADGEYGPMPFSRPAVEAVTTDTLTLVPAR